MLQSVYIVYLFSSIEFFMFSSIEYEIGNNIATYVGKQFIFGQNDDKHDDRYIYIYRYYNWLDWMLEVDLYWTAITFNYDGCYSWKKLERLKKA